MTASNQLSTNESSKSDFRVGEPLPKAMGEKDMCRAFGWSRATFYAKQREGALKPFELPRVIVRNKKYSGEKVQQFLNGRK